MNKQDNSPSETIVAGGLYLVSTPIGNLADLSARAVWVLENVDLIAAEDTRRVRRLPFAREGSVSLVPYHEHNAGRALPRIIERLKAGESAALVSDAGTPTVSDPGYRLVNAAIEAGITVIPIPGSSAVLAALSASGLPTDRFCFEGFLPRKKGRRTRLLELADEARTIVLFESPLRLGRTLRDLTEALGDQRRAVVAREITKRFEEFVRGTLGELAGQYGETAPKGEITLVIEGTGKRKRTKREINSDDK